MADRKAIYLTGLEAGVLAMLSLLLYPCGDRWLSAVGDANYFTALIVGLGRISHGTDLVFMRGPLNFLAFPKIDLPTGAYLSAIIFNLVSGWVLLAAPWYYFRQKVSYACAILLTLGFGLLAAPHVAFGVLYARWLLPTLLLQAYALERDSSTARMTVAVYAGAMAAAQLLIVFSSGLMALASFVVFICALAYRRSWCSACAGGISFAVVCTVGWHLTAGPEASFVSYLKESWAMSNSYGEVFARDLVSGFKWMMALAVAIAIAGAGVLIRHRQWPAVTFGLMASPVLFYFYKHGIIRHDSVSFYETIFGWGFILFLAGSIGSDSEFHNRGSIFCRWGGALLVVCSLFVMREAFSNNQLGNVGMSKGSPVKLIHDLNMVLKPSARAEQKALNREEIRASGLIPESFRSTIGRSPVAIIPQHVTLLEAYGMNWVIPPSLFAYLAVSPAQDSRDEAWYAEKGPPFVIWYPSGIDDQNIAWYEPMAMRAVASHYRVVEQRGDMTLLARRNAPLQMQMETVAEGVVPLDKSIDVPLLPDGSRIFAFLDIQLSTVGRLVSLFYRIDPDHLIVTWADGKTTRSRLLRENSANGLWLSGWVAQGVLDIDHPESEPQASQVTLDASRWVKSLFKPEIRYRIATEKAATAGKGEDL